MRLAGHAARRAADCRGPGVKIKSPSSLLFFLLAAALAGFFLSLALGPYPVPLQETVSFFFHRAAESSSLVLREIRLPRALLGLLVGASLGLSGAAMQGFLRNPLAEPGVLGVSGGASLGAVLVLYSGGYAIFPLALPLGGLAGSLVSVLLLYAMAGALPGTVTLVLTGTALNVLAYALTSLFLNLSTNPWAPVELVFWQMGSLADRSLDHVLLVLPFMALGAVLLLCNGQALNALTLGEDAARSLGVPVKAAAARLALGTALCTGAAVSVCGNIGFVGLLVPHLLRPWTGHEPRRLLAASALGGAVLVLAADCAVRFIPSGTEIKLGVLTSLIGAPFFMVLIYRMRREIF